MYFIEEAKHIPIPEFGNICICVSTDMRVDFCALVVNQIPDLGLLGPGTQVFPFYLYDEDGQQELAL